MVEACPNLLSPHQRSDGSLTRELGWIEGSTVAIASLALVLPGNGFVKAAIDGRLPHGMGVARLADLSAEWSRQRQMLGLLVL